MLFNSAFYVLRETFSSVRRNPWLSIASVITVMVSLVILGFSVLFLVNASNMAKTFESQLEIAVFVKSDADAQQVQDLQKQLEAMQGVESVTLVTKEQALRDFGKTLGGENGSEQNDLLTDLGGVNPFPDKFTVKATEPQLVAPLAEKFNTLENVENVRYGQDFVDNLLKFTHWLRWVGVGVIAAFAIASIVLISINIKMNVFSRKREIQIMKLVGATNAFIRWPFFIEGLTLGLIGGAIAAALVGLSYNWLASYIHMTLTFLPVVQNSVLFWQVTGGLIVIGMGIGAIGSAISLRQFLRV